MARPAVSPARTANCPRTATPRRCSPDVGDLSALDACVRDTLREREDELASLDAELRAVHFVLDVLTALRPRAILTWTQSYIARTIHSESWLLPPPRDHRACRLE